ncbi:BlaI/MecI/CopY family transcriptional regulator [Flagellimonas onchidii]|uniref:BlaI/MecI/CopY family transcriptional regulator n=1 Tax=Flagellimonas onchidii TaxID=2562684 RepID=UPI0010A6793B|nr:BlaI/MecI/CopY family transcriptional regulator [Allomuricauda onchidii]
MKTLTTAEERIMQILWKENKCNVAEIIDFFPDPKPAYNTVSTIVRILESKGFVSHYKKGRNHQYYPVILKSDYSQLTIKKFVKGYFQGSFSSMISFFMKNNDIDINELEEIIKKIKEL